MVIEKIVNNNMVISRGASGESLIVVGRGVGFSRRPGDQVREASVEAVFALHDPRISRRLIDLVGTIPLEDVVLGGELADYVGAHYAKKTSEMLLLILMDHVSNALRRHRRGMDLPNPMLYDIARIYPEELALGKDVVRIIRERLGVELGDDEAGFIALDIVNAQTEQDMSTVMECTRFVQRALDIVRSRISLPADVSSDAYERFLAHLKYLSYRIIGDGPCPESLRELGPASGIAAIRPAARKVVEDVDALCRAYYDRSLGHDEGLYLLMHLVTLMDSLGIPDE